MMAGRHEIVRDFLKPNASVVHPILKCTADLHLFFVRFNNDNAQYELANELGRFHETPIA